MQESEAHIGHMHALTVIYLVVHSEQLSVKRKRLPLMLEIVSTLVGLVFSNQSFLDLPYFQVLLVGVVVSHRVLVLRVIEQWNHIVLYFF